MDYSTDFQCCQCQNDFNKTDRTPHMIPSCGHSICQLCLRETFESDQPLICKEDEYKTIECPIRDSNLFPINQSIYKLMSKPRVGERSQTVHMDQESKEGSHFNSSHTFHTEPAEEEEQQDLQGICQLHNRKLELVCLDDFIHICVQCALFGDHKHHNYKQLEEVIKEINSRVSETTSVFEDLGQKQVDMNNPINEEMIKEQFQDCIGQSHKLIKEQFDEIMKTLQGKEEELMEQVENKILEIQQEYLKQQKEVYEKINEEANEWKRQSEQLVRCAPQTQNKEVALEVLQQDVNNSQNGQKIIQSIVNAMEHFQQNVNELLQVKYNVYIPPVIIELINSQIQLIQDGEQEMIQSQQQQLQELQFQQQQQQQQQYQQQQQQQQFQSNEQVMYSNEKLQQQQSDQMLLSGWVEQNSGFKGDQIKNTQNLSTSESGYLQQEQFQQSDYKIKPFKKNGKVIRLSEKVQQSINLVLSNQEELVEINQIDLGDEGSYCLAEALKESNVKVLKLIKCKLNDDHITKIVDVLDNSQLTALHLQHNNFTDKTMEYFVTYVRGKSKKGKQINLKSIFFNGNHINPVKSKRKIEEMKKLGIKVTL